MSTAIHHDTLTEQLHTLTRAFAALLLTTQRVTCKEQELKRRLKYAHDEVRYIYHISLFIYLKFLKKKKNLSCMMRNIPRFISSRSRVASFVTMTFFLHVLPELTLFFFFF